MIRSIVAIGDLFVDYISDLTNVDADLLGAVESSTNHFSSIDVKVGGAGLQFACCSKAVGFPNAAVIGKIGGQQREDGSVIPDLPGQELLRHLDRNDVHSEVAVDTRVDTGRIMIMYLPGNRRLMLSDPRANREFGTEDITPQMREAVRDADLLHVSGYAFLTDARRDAVVELMKEGSASQTFVALDVVPHDIYKFIGWAELKDAIDGIVDFGFIEVPCAHRLVGLGKLTGPPMDVVSGLRPLLLEVFPNVAIFATPDRAEVVFQGRNFTWQGKYEPGMNSRGQSAMAQAELLYELFGNGRR